MKSLLIPFLLLLVGAQPLFADKVKQEVQSQSFQGAWIVSSSMTTILESGEEDGEWKEKGQKVQIYFRRHASGAVQQIWKEKAGEVVKSRGVTILSAEEKKLRCRLWSDHPATYSEITLNDDGTALLVEKMAKHMIKTKLAKPKKPDAEPSHPTADRSWSWWNFMYLEHVPLLWSCPSFGSAAGGL